MVRDSGCSSNRGDFQIKVSGMGNLYQFLANSSYEGFELAGDCTENPNENQQKTRGIE